MFFGGFVVFKFLILNDILFMIHYEPLLVWEMFLKARESPIKTYCYQEEQMLAHIISKKQRF